MNVIIPMAGRGKRFNDVGYSFPKPLIDVNGKPMIQIIIENLNLTGKHIFICQKEHIKKFAIYDLMNLLKPNCFKSILLKSIAIDVDTNNPNLWSQFEKVFFP